MHLFLVLWLGVGSCHGSCVREAVMRCGSSHMCVLLGRVVTVTHFVSCWVVCVAPGMVRFGQELCFPFCGTFHNVGFFPLF